MVQILTHEDALVLRTEAGRVGAYVAQGKSAQWGLGAEAAVRFMGWEDEDRTHLFLLDETGRITVRRFSDGVEAAVRVLTPAPPAGPMARIGDFMLFAESGSLTGYRFATGEQVFDAPLPEGEVRMLATATGATTSLVAVTLGAGGILLGEVHESGYRERWRNTEIGDVRGSALVIPEREMLVAGTLEGSLSAFRLADGRRLWSWFLMEGFRQPPHAGERFLFAPTEANTLYAFELRGGSERWRAALPGRPAGRPFEVGTRLLIATRDGLVVEFDPRTGIVGGGLQDMKAEVVGVVHGVTEAEPDETGTEKAKPDETGTKKAELEQASNEKTEPEQADAKKTELEQASNEKTEPEQADNEKAELEQTSTEKAKPEQADTEKTEPEQADNEKAEPEQTDNEKTEPEQADAKKTKPEQADNEKTEPEQADNEKAEPEQADNEKTKPEQTDNEKTEPEQTDNEKTEPEQADNEKTEPEQADNEGWKARRLYLGLRDGRLVVLGPRAAGAGEAAPEEPDRLRAVMPDASSPRPGR